MLGIMPGSRIPAQERKDCSSDDDNPPKSPRALSHRRSTSALKKFSQSFKRKKEKSTARDLLPARFIRCTSVKPNTLNPKWEEEFRWYILKARLNNNSELR